MKFVLIALSFLLSQTAFSMDYGIDFKDNVEVEKVVMDEILINNLIKLYNDYDYEGERMMAAGEFNGERKLAGEFDGIAKKIAKKNYLESLRTKLEGSQGPTRF
jgi:hypothetical protein